MHAAETWLSDSPVPRPRTWLAHLNAPMTEADLESIRRSVNRGTPFGEEEWAHVTARRLGRAASLRPARTPE
jgi:REP-associated tyrosine transposase